MKYLLSLSTMNVGGTSIVNQEKKDIQNERFRVTLRSFAINYQQGGMLNEWETNLGAAGSVFATSLGKAYLRMKSRQGNSERAQQGWLSVLHKVRRLMWKDLKPGDDMVAGTEITHLHARQLGNND